MWNTILPIIVRNITGDTGPVFRYTDDQVIEAILVSVLLVSQEIELSTEYSIDFEARTLSPDPTSSANYDPLLMSLVALKSACMFNTNDYQSAVRSGIRVRDDDSEVDLTAGFKGYSDILKMGPCKSYEALLEDARQARSASMGKAIMTPMTHEDFTLNTHSSMRYLFDYVRATR